MTDAKTDIDVHGWTAQFSNALKQGDIAAVTELFADGGMWRDLLAFTWDIQSLEDRDQMAQMLAERLAKTEPKNFTVEEETSPTEAWLSFETAFGDCRGHVRLHDGRAFTFLTALQDLKGHARKRNKNRKSGVYDDGDSRNWLQRKEAEQEQLETEKKPYVLIVGGGQGGLALGAQLRMQDVPFVIIDRHEKPGDQWRSRYKSLTLHDPVWFDHMPIIPFPESWPIYTPKDRVADFLESYAKILDLPFWGNTEFTSATYDQDSSTWNVAITRDGEQMTLCPKHVVMAVGNAGFPRRPEFEGAQMFKGKQLHSSEFKSGANFVGKKVVVVGANNSAHDICADLVENGIQPTMIQRSSTLILSASTNRTMAAAFYSEEACDAGITTERADFLGASMPIRMNEQHQKGVWKKIEKQDEHFYGPLRNAGFQLDFGEDGTGLWMKYLRSGSGYYIDVGASAMVMDGRIALKSQVEVTRLTENSVVLSDGSEIEADAIVYATGFGSMDQWVKRLISEDVADRIGPCWGYGSGTRGDPGPWEGELRNMWKPTAQEGLWFHGGNLQQSRFYSHYLATQLKARLEGVDVS